MATQRFNVFGRLFDVARRGEQWAVLTVGNDGKRAPAGFVIPKFVKDEELEQFLFDLFHEQAAYKRGDVYRVERYRPVVSAQPHHGVPMRIHGSCHCGAIRYEATVDPARTGICHCTDCQKLTGSAYRVSVPAQDGSFQLLAGEPRIYIKRGDQGSRRAQAFCPNCGSPLYTYDADHPLAIGLRVGCIEEREALAPRKQKWCRSALGWTQSLAGLESFDGE